MGIPKLFRWLTDQYPVISQRLDQGLNEVSVFCFFYCLWSAWCELPWSLQKEHEKTICPRPGSRKRRLASCYISDAVCPSIGAWAEMPLRTWPPHALQLRVAAL